MLQAGEVLLDRYEIIQLVGVGGMSAVYKVKDLKTNQILAAKKVKRTGKEKDQVVEQSLATEGRMLKRLSNAHLTKIHEIVEDNDSILLVMDFIEGESLDKLLERDGPQSVALALNWGMQICDVLDYLHNQPTPIIYRDMKPANIMLQPNGRLMVIDFGTARTQKVDKQMAEDTITFGTEGFAAPEQYGGQGQSTARTDIFCLGATLYNIVTGFNPSKAPKGILPVSHWDPALANTPIAEIILKCTRPDPNERYQTAMELYQALYQALTGTYKGKAAATGKLGWNKQDAKGLGGLVSGGLSGLLQRGIGGLTGQLQNKNKDAPQTEVPVVTGGKGWQTTQGHPPRETTSVSDQQNEPNSLLLSQLVSIGLAIAVIFVLLTIVLTVLRIYAAAVVFLVIAAAAAIMGLVCMMLLNRQ